MTAHRKAFELFNKMYKYQLDKKNPVSWELAKKQALVAAREVSDELQSYNDMESTIVQYGGLKSVVELIIYWNEVISEIEAL